jgi:thioredoxin-like negative regulator of GroEL
MVNVPELSDQSFDQEVRGTPAAVVCFRNPGCPSDDPLAPVMEELARDYAGRVKFAVLDVCDNVETPGELGVLGFPTLVFFKEGHEVSRRFGAIKRERLVDAIRTNLQL